MTSSSFALAQERLHTRRQAREIAAQASRPPNPSSDRLPFPLRFLGHASLSTWERIKGREGTGPAFRVGQVDAELLDEELLEMLRGQAGEGLKYFGVRTLLDDWVTRTDSSLEPSERRLERRDITRSTGCPFQALHLGPQRHIRCCLAKPSIHRCAEYESNTTASHEMAEINIWSCDRWRFICLAEME